MLFVYKMTVEKNVPIILKIVLYFGTCSLSCVTKNFNKPQWVSKYHILI